MDSNHIQRFASTLMVAELHKEAQQATGGLTYLGVTDKEEANLHLSSKHDVLVSSCWVHSSGPLKIKKYLYFSVCNGTETKEGPWKHEGQWVADERKATNLDQRLKSPIKSVLPDDQMNYVINYLTTKSTWDDLILYHNGPSDVKDSELASLFGKLKYKENLINSIYETKKNKSLVPATHLSTAFFSTYIVQDFQDSPDDEEDTRSSREYLNDIEEEYQARDLLAMSKRFFKKGTQSLSQHKPKLRPTKDFVPKYNKVKAKLVKNKGLIVEAYAWDEEKVSSDDNEMVEVKVLMALAEENDAVSKECAKNGEWVKISLRNVHILFEMEDNDDRKVCLDYLCIDLNYVKEQRSNLLILPYESQKNTTDSLVAITNSSATDYDSADESSVCSIPLPPLKKLDGAEPISGPKTIKSILRLKSTFKSEALKDVTINEPSSAPAKGNKISLALKVHSDPTGKLKSMKIKDDPPLAIVMKELNNLKLQFSKNQSYHSRNDQSQHTPQNKYKTQFKKSCELCGLNNHLIENCYKVLFAKK
nr:hypothetical protein [Tanacetum cinerariifolium]